jgi:surface antigen
MLAAMLPATLLAAGEVPVFKDTVIAKFNAEDTRLMLDRIDTALKSGQEGVPLAWRNDKSGASGTATPLNRLRWNALDCRRVRVINRHGSMTGESVYRFCEKPKGEWKMVGPDTGQ